MPENENANEKRTVKTIGLVFIDRFADWEYGLLAASAVEWFGARTIAITPNGEPVRSMSGFQLNPQRSANPVENADLDAVVVIGSDVWASCHSPDVSPLLTAVAARGGVVGGICAGTLALARAGLFAEVRHTSNERPWLDHHLPDYPGRPNYEELAHAVADGRIVSAPGSAPGTFAVEFLRTLFPERAAQMGEMRGLFAREYAEAS
jgi:putative intracellular protease/amidase